MQQKEIKENEVNKILLVFTIGFCLLSFLFKLPILSYIGVGIGLLGLISPSFGLFFAKFWMKFAGILGKINGTILLSIVFFLMLFPISLLQKIFSRKDNLRLKLPKESNFVIRDKKYKKEDLEKMW